MDKEQAPGKSFNTQDITQQAGPQYRRNRFRYRYYQNQNRNQNRLKESIPELISFKI